MLTIAGGIILAIVIIYTIPLWLPIVLGMGMIAIVLALLLVVGVVFYHFPEAGIVVAIVATVIFFCVYLGGLLDEVRKKSKERKRKKIDKENIPNRVNKLKAEFVEPGVLIRHKSKAEMIELANDFEIEFSETDTKREIAEKIFQIGGGRLQDTLIKNSPSTKIDQQKEDKFKEIGEVIAQPLKDSPLTEHKEWDSSKDPFMSRAHVDSANDIEREAIIDEIRNHNGIFTESIYADLLIKVRESLNNPLGEGSKEMSAFDKIEMVRKKEVSRLQKMKEKEEEKKRQKEEEKRKEEEEKRKENELNIEKFSRIKPTLQEIEDTYLKDKDIDVEINDTHGILRYGKNSLYITSETGTAKKKYLVFDGRDRTYPENHFLDAEKTIDYIVHKIGVFLAKRK